MDDKDIIYRQDAIDAIVQYLGRINRDFENWKGTARIILDHVPPVHPKRVWTPCDIPPSHHKDVIVRGVEAIGDVAVYKIMQWDVDRWRPENYAPSITWLDWSEI